MTGTNDTIQDQDNYSTFSNSSTIYDSKDVKSLPRHDTTEHHRPVRGRLDKAMDLFKRKRSSKLKPRYEDSEDNSVPEIKRNAQDNILSPDGSVETLLPRQGSTTPSTQQEMTNSDSSTIQEDHNEDSAHHNSETGSMKVPRGKLLDKLRGSKSGKTANQGSSAGATQNQGNQPPVQEGGPSSGSAQKDPPSKSGSGSGSGPNPAESDPDVPVRYTIMTKFDTPISNFEKFIADLDNSQGSKLIIPGAGFQAYTLFLKRSKAAALKRHPIVLHVLEEVWGEDGDDEFFNAGPRTNSRVNKLEQAGLTTKVEELLSNDIVPRGQSSDHPKLNSRESDSDSPMWYTIMTKIGTSISDFDKFIKDLDGGKGSKSVLPKATFQGYGTFLRPSEVAAVEQHPVVRLVMKDEWRDDHSEEVYSALPRVDTRGIKRKRADRSPQGEGSNIDFQDKSPDHLSLISQGPGSIKSALGPYMLSPKAGEGVTIYVIDSGLNPAHPDFAKSYDPKEFFIATHEDTGPHIKDYHGQPYSPESESVMMDLRGHGHCMASLVAGATHGVAKKAKVVPIKYKYKLGKVTHRGILAAFGYIVNKVENAPQHSKPGTAVINLSGGYTKDLFKTDQEFEDRRALLNDWLKRFWKLDIVTVIATSNKGEFSTTHSLEKEVPACLGRSDNPLITVGAATADGKRYFKTTKEDGGSITVWAKGDMPTYCAATEGSGSQKQDGSSGAAAQVSGLAAYFLSLSKKELAVPKNWPMKATVELYGLDLHVKGKVAQLVKDYIVGMSHVRTEGGVNMAYNGAEERVCEVVKASDIKQKRAVAPKKNAYGLTPLIVAGKLVGNRPGLSSCPARSSQPPVSSKTASKTKSGASKATSHSRAATHSAKKAKGRPVRTAKARQTRAIDLSSKQERERYIE